MSFSLPSSPKIKSKFKSSSSSFTSNSSNEKQFQLSSTPIIPLPNSHPLIAELTSLRQQLSQYQKAAHQASIQLQGVRLELTLSQEKEIRWERERDSLKKEVEILRTNPEPPIPLPTSNALTELSLAHRRLSTKLDLTESELNSTKLDLAKANSEIERLTKEREGDRSTINELRRIEDDREEELEWEKGERRKLEEQKKLCDLALAEYSTLVHSLDPTAVPPSNPTKSTSSIFNTPSSQRSSLDGDSSIHSELDTPPLTSTSTAITSPSPSAGEVISNLLIGQKGVQQLFTDFTSFLTSKDKRIHELETKVEELEHSTQTLTEQLRVAIEIRVEAENIKDRVLRDDESASKVIERYMIFTQKTHQTIHLHLNNLRARSTATTNSLRNELADYKKDLIIEREKNSTLLNSYNDLLENYLNESTGRRREISLRLKMISNQEKRGKSIENWLNKVKILRESIEGPVLEPDVLENLLDEGIEVISNDYSIVSNRRQDEGQNDKFKSWRKMGNLIKSNKSQKVDDGDNQINSNYEEESLARILLAEELVNTLVNDLQIETEKRMELERQRVEWLAKDAVDGVRVASNKDGIAEDGHVMFDIDDHDPDPIRGTLTPNGSSTKEPILIDTAHVHNAAPSSGANALEENDQNEEGESVPAQAQKDSDDTIPAPRSSTDESSPLVDQLSELFEPINTRYEPLQKTLHDLSHSLTNLKNDLPILESSNPSTPSTSKPNKKSHFLIISKLPSSSFKPSHDPTLLAILDELHEVIEDARVDVEIALADHERVYRGFEALLNVGKKKQSKKEEIMNEIKEYVKSKKESLSWEKLKIRIENIEFDLMLIKRSIHEIDGMEINILKELSNEKQLESNSNSNLNQRRKNVWENLNLKTISTTNIPNNNQIKTFFVGGISPTPISSSPLNSPFIDEYGFSITSNNNINNFQNDSIKKPSNVFSTVGNVSRSFSNSIIGTPRRVSDLATGLYRPNNRKSEEENSLINDKVNEEDDVE
ncbi:uncharacterized protein I206_106414 [Kwoniella pini CBS 10737]|uniref:Uncharacterized protein n=1 Tax=Kwoniella pini CBS 10737 TaxID=1296096 RepID=A0A1B9HU86_9TREE|nr:uncharacterized protein I206_07218 [Kwoniella pini CBS 10737]OCF46831.1 hypothetical protein I206_07218 [Kwoniella pini CBS 10737]